MARSRSIASSNESVAASTSRNRSSQAVAKPATLVGRLREVVELVVVLGQAEAAGAHRRIGELGGEEVVREIGERRHGGIDSCGVDHESTEIVSRSNDLLLAHIEIGDATLEVELVAIGRRREAGGAEREVGARRVDPLVVEPETRDAAGGDRHRNAGRPRDRSSSRPRSRRNVPSGRGRRIARWLTPPRSRGRRTALAQIGVEVGQPVDLD